MGLVLQHLNWNSLAKRTYNFYDPKEAVILDSSERPWLASSNRRSCGVWNERHEEVQHLEDLREATLAEEVEEQVALLQHLLPTETAALLLTPALQLPANPTARYKRSLQLPSSTCPVWGQICLTTDLQHALLEFDTMTAQVLCLVNVHTVSHMARQPGPPDRNDGDATVFQTLPIKDHAKHQHPSISKMLSTT